MVETPILETPRLLLTPLTLRDSGAVQAVFPRWEIVRFLGAGMPWPYPPDGALSYIRDVALPAVRRGVEWHWAIRPADDPSCLIGLVGLRDEPDDNRGFWLAPEWQGLGLMTEASEAVTRFWFEVLGRPVLRAPKAAANTASRRISQRQGMRVLRTEERAYVSGRHLAEIWELTAEDWRAMHPVPGTTNGPAVAGRRV